MKGRGGGHVRRGDGRGTGDRKGDYCCYSYLARSLRAAPPLLTPPYTPRFSLRNTPLHSSLHPRLLPHRDAGRGRASWCREAVAVLLKLRLGFRNFPATPSASRAGEGDALTP